MLTFVLIRTNHQLSVDKMLSTTVFPSMLVSYEIFKLNKKSLLEKPVGTNRFRGTTLVASIRSPLHSDNGFVAVFPFIKTAAFTTKKKLRECNSCLRLY